MTTHLLLVWHLLYFYINQTFNYSMKNVCSLLPLSVGIFYHDSIFEEFLRLLATRQC